ncbi:MAG: M20/M25/M40 family metallo-hydrolase, partial [Acidobacteriota bacterium]
AAKPILLLNHLDVVPTDPARWSHDPFAAEIADGKIWGRGTIDMKGLGVVQLMAFLSLKRQNVPLDRDVIFMAVPDEEVGGGLGAEWMLKNHFSDIDPEFILDEGGLGSRDLFAAGKLVFGISVAEKKLIWLKLRAVGVSGHGSQPNDQNPNDHLTRALARMLSEPLPTSPFSVLETMKSRVGPLAANKFNNAIQHSTISITTLRSGVGDPPKVNVIPSVAEATLDCRVLPGTTTEQWVAEIRRRLSDPSIEIEIINEGADPTVTAQDSSFYRALESAVKRKHPEAIVTPMVVPYTTDSNKYRPRGVKAYGFTPVIVPAAAVASMHGDAEFLPIDAIGPAIQILFEALKETAG